MDKMCPICKLRVNEWQIVNGKTTSINNLIMHNSCREQFQLTKSRDWTLAEIAKELSGG